MSSRTVLWSLRLGRYSGKIVGKKNFWKRVMEKKMTLEYKHYDSIADMPCEDRELVEAAEKV